MGKKATVTITVPEDFKKMTCNGSVLYLDGADGYTSPWAETAHKFAKLEKSVKCCGFYQR